MTKVTFTPSQWVNIFWLLLAIAGSWQFGSTLIFWYLIPVVLWIWKFAVIECWKFSVDEDTDTIIETKGVFSQTKVEIQYFRIKSIKVLKPFYLRIFGLSTVEVVTSEPFQPYLRLYAVEHGEEWATFLKEMAVYWREVKGVKETDFHSF
jgi:uncharacterized membrane protein YdbT with pleckstrin-like domain